MAKIILFIENSKGSTNKQKHVLVLKHYLSIVARYKIKIQLHFYIPTMNYLNKNLRKLSLL